MSNLNCPQLNDILSSIKYEISFTLRLLIEHWPYGGHFHSICIQDWNLFALDLLKRIFLLLLFYIRSDVSIVRYFHRSNTISMDKSSNGGADSLFFALMLPLLLYMVYLIREFQVSFMLPEII